MEKEEASAKAAEETGKKSGFAGFFKKVTEIDNCLRYILNNVPHQFARQKLETRLHIHLFNGLQSYFNSNSRDVVSGNASILSTRSRSFVSLIGERSCSWGESLL
ncbi:hypothetical protein PENTCL1PPCAC_24398 [Pristionchus entomophagus]|uniref:Uncharacterized protein n=1 Tax=Pristionchus entomophagus TaxID=358040 RepID=A0AAV5U5V6_9BILA|nr:hypothetical protein PENTCL1PPCAC_24398 [Pristionchus entomophagus]